jgi:hypothetical protein
MWKYMLPSYFFFKNITNLHIYKCNLINNKQVLNIKFISCFKPNNSNKIFTDTENLENGNNNYNLKYNYNKYKIFRDEDAPVIFDINEEKDRIKFVDLNLEELESDLYNEINFNRKLSE